MLQGMKNREKFRDTQISRQAKNIILRQYEWQEEQRLMIYVLGLE